MSSHSQHNHRDNDPSGEQTSSCLSRVFMTFVMGGLALVLLAAATSTGQTGGQSGECQVSTSFPEEVRQWCGLITEHATEAGLPPDLVAALIWQESGGNSLAYSRSGAVGLMQVMPRDGKAEAFRCKGKPCFSDRPSIAELQDPAFNIQYGTQMLGRLVRHHGGDLREALRAYGPIDMGYRYADIVLGLYEQYGR
jgi:hypothetical protein